MKNELSLQPTLSNNLSVVSNFISVTNKLVISQNRELVKKIFLKNNKFFFEIISAYYPLPKNLIYKYADNLNWEGLASNEQITWDKDFIEKNFSRWELKHDDTWVKLSFNKKIPWSVDLIKNNLGNWQFDPKYFTPDQCLSSNPEVIKNLDILDAFTDYWNWEMLSKSHAIPWTAELIEMYLEKWDWSELSANTSLPWSFSFILKFAHKWKYKYLMRHLDDNVVLQHKESVLNNYSHTSPAFKVLNMFEVSETELLKHKDKLTWRLLGLFGKAKWSSKSLQLYGGKLDWGALSSNENLNWSSDLIAEFEDYWVWPKLYYNEGITWTISLLEKYRIKLGLGEYDDYWKVINLDNKVNYEEEYDENIETNNQSGEEYDEEEDYDEYEEIEETIKYYREYRGTVFSRSKNIDWNVKMYQRYNNLLDYHELEDNESIKVSEKLEDWPDEKHYFLTDFWLFAYRTLNIPLELIKEKDYYFELLSSNKNFAWTEEIFKKFKYDCDIDLLANNPSFPWSMDILREVLDLNPPIDGIKLLTGLVTESQKDESLVEFKDLDGVQRYIEEYEFYPVGAEVRILKDENSYGTNYEISKMGLYRLSASSYIWEVIKPYVDDQLINEILDSLKTL